MEKIMEEVRAYQATDGSLHATDVEAAAADLVKYSQAQDLMPISFEQAKTLVVNRDKVIVSLEGVGSNQIKPAGYIPPRASPTPTKGNE